MPEPYEPTRRETVVWIAAGLVTIVGRRIARAMLWLARCNWRWWTGTGTRWKTVAFVASWASAGWWLGGTALPSLVSRVTVGPSHVEAASEPAASPDVLAYADPRLQGGYIDPSAVGNETPARDDPMQPLVPQAPAAEEATGPAGVPLPAWLPPTVARWEPNIRSAAGRYAVDPALVAIIVTVESAGNPVAGSGAGALGLMQVVPRWHPTIQDGAGPYDPDHNLDVGSAFLADLLRTYAVAGDDANDWQATVERAAAAFNGGPGGVTNPVAETRSYVRWIGGMWAERRDASSPTFDEWRAAGGQVALDIAATVDGPPMYVQPVAPGGPDHLEVMDDGR